MNPRSDVITDAHPTNPPAIDWSTENYHRSLQSEGEDPGSLLYNEQEIYLQGKFYKVKMFPCVNTAERVWYVTYAFKEHQMFLVKLSEYTEILKIRGFIVRRTILDARSADKPANASFGSGAKR
jgi:hypothetical protein